MSTFAMYWLVMLDSICGGLLALTILLGIVAILAAIVVFATTWDTDLLETRRRAKAWMKRSLLAFLLVLVLLILTPTTKQAAIIVVVPKVISAVQESKELKGVPEKVLGLANAWLDELKPTTQPATSK